MARPKGILSSGPRHDLRGRVFGRLTALRWKRHPETGQFWWICSCKCGREHRAKPDKLMNGGVQSCGCLKRDLHTKHGLCNTSEYNVWKQMMQRCNNPKHTNYKHYGGRGVQVDPRWHDFKTFYKDLGPRPSPSHTLERHNDDQGYGKENCGWILRRQQMRNARQNHNLICNGQTKCLAEWSEITGLLGGTIIRRSKRGWSDEKILTTPTHYSMLCAPDWWRTLGWNPKTGEKVRSD